MDSSVQEIRFLFCLPARECKISSFRGHLSPISKKLCFLLMCLFIIMEAMYAYCRKFGNRSLIIIIIVVIIKHLP